MTKYQTIPPTSGELSRWAVVAHNDDTGFGRMAEDMKIVLGLERHLVIPSERLANKLLSHPGEILLSPHDTEETVRALLKDLDGIIFYERHSWNPHILPVAKELGVKSVCVPTWEWFRGTDEPWRLCDLFICPHQLCLTTVRKYGFGNSIMLPWTLDIKRLPVRHIKGLARLFIHNAGLVDPDDRKGTKDTINAFKQVRGQDVRLIVRLQKEIELPPLDDRIEVRVGNLADPAQLYQEGDVAIQPSKMEGIGFMVLEPVCAGLPVISLNYPPMNNYVRQEELLVRRRWFKRKAFPSHWVKHAHLRLPDVKDLAGKIEWCAVNDLSEVSQANRQWAQETFDREKLRGAWSQVLTALKQGTFQPQPL